MGIRTMGRASTKLRGQFSEVGGAEDIKIATASNSPILRTIPLLIAVCLLSFPAYGKYGGANGTAEDPYQIATAEDLILLGEEPNDYDKHFILVNDIDLDPNLPGRRVFDTALIAPDTSPGYNFQGTPFTGVLDGDDHIISNLSIDTRGASNHYLGLFGMIGEGAKVRNLGIEHADITGGTDSSLLGLLVGDNLRGTIFRCHTSGSVIGGCALGGLVGYNREGTITDCRTNISIRGEQLSDFLGGLVGDNASTGDLCITPGTFGGWIANCYATGSVSAGDYSMSLGGLVGYFGDGSITNSYSTANVTGGKRSRGLGGLVGEVGTALGDDGGPVTNCYATGSVTAGEDSSGLGGLVGAIWLGTVSNCFWDVQRSGISESARGTGLATAQMQTAAPFLDAGWDFVNVWDIGENQTYPYLRKHPAADINQDGSVNFLDLCSIAEQWMQEQK
jgi:hypothetical protein